MKRNKKLIFVVAIIGLAGMIGCVLLEPALAYVEDTATDGSDGEHCCLICHSSHHQWDVSKQELHLGNDLNFAGTVSQRFAFYLKVPPRAIFHPPATL